MTAPDIDVQDVTDPDDPRLDDFRDLNSVDRRPDLPTGKGLVIAEGVLVVQRMLASRFTPRALLGTDRRLAELKDDLTGTPAPYYRTSAEVMAQAVGFHLNRGVLASASRVPEPSVDKVVTGARSGFRWAMRCWCPTPEPRTGRPTWCGCVSAGSGCWR